MGMLWAADVVTPIIEPLAGSLRAAFLGGGSLAIGIGVAVWSLKKGWLLFKDLLADKGVRNMTYDIAGSQDVANGTWQPDCFTSYEARGGSDESDSYTSGGVWDGQDAAEQEREQDAAAKSYLDRYR